MVFPFGFPGYDGIRRHGPFLRVVLGFRHLDHTDKVAAYPSGHHEPDQLLAGEPAVHEQVVKTEALKEGPLDHPDGILKFADEVLVRPLRGAVLRIALLAVTGVRLFLREAVRLGGAFAHLPLEGEM